jgi:uncharacterized protein (TIGR02246 family)
MMGIACSNLEGQQNAQDEQEIKKTIAAYTDAFNKHDAAAVASFWAEDAVYINPESGDETEGREDIQDLFEGLFADNPNQKITIQTQSVSFPAANQAEEKGIVTNDEGDGLVTKQAYKVLYEKVDGKWLIKQVREVDVAAPPVENEHLKQLAWLIGEWTDQDEDSDNEVKTTWDKYKNFITQSFTYSVEGNFELEGKQLIAWDPIKKSIRSWIFDSDGSFGEGTWKQSGKSWVVEMTQTLADGKRATSTQVYTPVNADSYTWKSTDREINGEILPDIETVTVTRKRGTAK